MALAIILVGEASYLVSGALQHANFRRYRLVYKDTSAQNLQDGESQSVPQDCPISINVILRPRHKITSHDKTLIPN